MSTPNAAPREVPERVKCPGCKRDVMAYPDVDGLGRPRGWLRIGNHAGPKWGRPCEMGGELYEPKEPPQ